MTSLTLRVYSSLPNISLWPWLCAAANSLFHKTKEDIEVELMQIKKAQFDPHEFAPIYNKYYHDIFIYVNRRIEDMDMVADITSRTFANCLSNINNFKYMGVPFSAWLYKIAINEVRQFFRTRKNYPRTVCLSEKDFTEISQETIEESRYEHAQEIVPKLLSQLSEIDLQCIELRFFEKKSFREIGFLLGFTEVNAKIRTYRVLKKLKEIATKK